MSNNDDDIVFTGTDVLGLEGQQPYDRIHNDTWLYREQLTHKPWQCTMTGGRG
jgi:hypothetical protein